ncbi:MAG: hypothetical protein NT001_06545 [Candidatus Woesearchaeota archaeon]|nr:hypothetical protein [Candidatus Woesearchaeota archaeon]
MKKIFLAGVIVIISLLIVSAVYAAFGVETPVPSLIQLLRGESGRFRFQIQLSSDEPENMFCSYVLKNVSDLIIEFDNPGPLEIAPGKSTVVLGTVTAPATAEPGKHTENFCVSCRKANNPEGAAVMGVYCTPEINVEVVDSRTRENMQIPPKPAPEKTNTMLIAGIIAGAVIALMIIIFLIFRIRRRKKQ